MRSESSIQLDFQQAKARADELDRIASDIQNLANRDVDDAMQQLSRAWQGEAASQYLQKGGQMKDKMMETVRRLNDTATTIRNTAQRIYDAEMRALELARQREYLLQRLLGNK